ncbi:MAG: hypothetical protein M3Y56_13690, partial [Armatimonadota bacterium]|nr:hypothetical protein [Armatimonadota bacterium]
MHHLHIYKPTVAIVTELLVAFLVITPALAQQGLSPANGDSYQMSHAQRKAVPLTAVRIEDSFWAPKQTIYREK